MQSPFLRTEQFYPVERLDETPIPNRNCVAGGWGLTKVVFVICFKGKKKLSCFFMILQYEGQLSQNLLKADIYTVDYNACNALRNGLLGKNVLCAGSMRGVKGFCQGNINF